MNKNSNVPDFLVRAVKTFIQAFIPVIIANIALIGNHIVNWDFSDWKGWLAPILISAVAAGISAIWNLILEKINAKAQTQILANLDEEELAAMLSEFLLKEDKADKKLEEDSGE